MTRAGATIYGCEGLALSAEERRFFRDARPWGFILFARNIDTPDQVLALTNELRATVGWNAPVLIDQEGGRVARLRPPHWREWPSVSDFCARAGDKALEALALRFSLIATELQAVGVDVDCMPMLDVAQDGAHPIIADRVIGATPAEITERGRIIIDALARGGVAPVVKHMPGHGRASVDSHEGPPVVDAPLEELGRTDFAPFHALADAAMGMTGHIVFTALDPDRPATLSPVVVEKAIREAIGFDGLLMTDDISMGALTGPIDERARQALAAGCDLILHCNGDLAEMVEIAGAAGELSGDARRRADRAEDSRPALEAFDTAEADDRLAEIFKEMSHV